MINLKFKKTKTSDLDIEIERLLAKLTDLQPTEEDYNSASDQLSKLYKLRLESNSKERVSPDALVAAGASLLGILVLVSYEYGHVIASKAIGFVIKPK